MIFTWVVKAGLTKNVTFEQMSEGDEGLSVWINWGESLPGSRESCWKGHRWEQS